MTKQNKKRFKPELLAYHQEGYVDLQLRLPDKWVIAIVLAFVIKLIPEWWGYFQSILPILLK